MINDFKKNKENSKVINPYVEIKEIINKNPYNDKNKIIEVKNIKHEFKKGKSIKKIYDDISFDIYENEKLAFLGPNGSGKTLTISTLCGIFKEKSGNIKYNFDYDIKPYEKLSVQFQDLQFPSSLTPFDLIKFSLKIENINDISEEIKEALREFEIDSIMNTKMSKLSGGQQQRVNVLIAMLGKPKVLFLDEFTTGLDIAIKNRIQNYIIKFCNKNKITLVLISHDIDCIEDMSERIIILADKRIIVDEKVENLKKEFGSVKIFLKKYILM